MKDFFKDLGHFIAYSIMYILIAVLAIGVVVGGLWLIWIIMEWLVTEAGLIALILLPVVFVLTIEFLRYRRNGGAKKDPFPFFQNKKTK